MTEPEVYRTYSPEETEAIGEELAERLEPGDRVGLVGELGGGKTCFVRGIARGLGLNVQGADTPWAPAPPGDVRVYVKSPSFTLLNIYEGGRVPLYHIDLYRLTDIEEYFDSGLEEYVYSNGVTVIEWADKLPGLMEECDIVVRFSHIGEEGREITIEGPWE